jgi:hypothetical protein
MMMTETMKFIGVYGCCGGVIMIRLLLCDYDTVVIV